MQNQFSIIKQSERFVLLFVNYRAGLIYLKAELLVFSPENSTKTLFGQEKSRFNVKKITR
jgi:hypothetical protein